MSNEIQKFNLDNNIRLLLLRYLNDIKKVAEEASKYAGANIPETYVYRVYLKFKKQRVRETDYWVAANIVARITQEYEHRLVLLEAMYRQWDGKEIAKVSLCCSAPIEEYEVSGKKCYTCLKCGKDCHAEMKYLTDLERLKLKLIEQMREESAHLVDAAQKLGFTNGEMPPVNKTTNYNLILNQTGRKSIEPNPEIVRQIEQMNPRDADKLRKELEQQIVKDAEFDEPNEEIKKTDG